MPSIIDFALEHVRAGRSVFPGRPNTKFPALSDPYEQCTKNESEVLDFWTRHPDFNICIPCGVEFEPGKFLFVIDIDKKEDRNGFKTKDDLEMLGLEFTETLTQNTPTGGLHLFYFSKIPLKNSVDALGKGIDTRGFHGYVVGAGSKIDGKEYSFKNKCHIAQVPDWVIERCKPSHPSERRLSLVHDVNSDLAIKRAKAYLERAQPAQAGTRNQRGYETACRIKDLGLTPAQAKTLMATDWQAEPPLESEELEAIVNSAFRYGENPPGNDTPEASFSKIEIKKEEVSVHPFTEINKEYFYTVSGGVSRICRETTDYMGQLKLERMSVPTFHEKLAYLKMNIGDKSVSTTKLWMQSKDRRSYEGIVFSPNKNTEPRFYNLWRGFAVEPHDMSKAPHPKAKAALEALIEHVYKNVADGNQAHGDWIMGYFAHMVQKPEQKPGVALVLKGGKGVGKNALIDRIGSLFGEHFVTVSDRRYLVGNFNSILENKILFTLDEAFWSGEKAIEGILKSLVTSETKVIEHKGSEPYTVRSCERVIILGNEKWIVPSTEDERRYAVFKVGDGRKQDQDFFEDMRVGMEEFGGSSLLLRYLMDFDLSNIKVRVAPVTKELNVQKEMTLGPVEKWWLGCIEQGVVPSCGIEEWPVEISNHRLRDAFIQNAKDENIRGRLPGDKEWGQTMFKLLNRKSLVKRSDGVSQRTYDMPTLQEAREAWQKIYGSEWEWDTY